MKNKTLYKDALKKWGLEAQLGMLMEECAELIQASNKLSRAIDKVEEGKVQGWFDNFVYELADVEIMIEQMKLLVRKEKFNEFKNHKLKKMRKQVYGK